MNWQLIVAPTNTNPGATVQMNVGDTYAYITNDAVEFLVDTTEVSINWGGLTAKSWVAVKIDDLAWIGDRPIWVDASGQIIEITGWGGSSFNITDDFAQTHTISSGDTLEVVGRPGNSVVKTYFSNPLKLEVRLEWGAPGQVVGYDSEFGAGWVSGMLTYSDTITPIAGSPLVITHNWWTTKVQVSVYDTTTGEEVTPTVVSRDNDNVRITMPTSDEIEIVIIWFI